MMYKDTVVKEHLTKVYRDLIGACHEPLRSMLANKIFFAGGCIKSLIHGEPVKDYDMWFFCPDDALKVFMHTFAGLEGLTADGRRWQYRNPQFKTETAYWVRSVSDNAINIKGPEKTMIQLIFTTSGAVDEVTKNFDFKHCTAHFNPMTQVLYVPREAYNKDLVYQEGSPYPVSALKRAMKFKGQGWDIEDEDLIKIAKDIQKIDLSSDTAIERHLRGLYRV